MSLGKGYCSAKTGNYGVTLIELMVVVAIVGIIAAIAYPSYTEYVRRSNRTDARSVLMDTAQKLERCMGTYGAYNNAGCNLVFPLESRERYYSIAAADAVVTATTFTLTARPVAGTAQAADVKCTSFTLTHTSNRIATGTDSANCW